MNIDHTRMTAGTRAGECGGVSSHGLSMRSGVGMARRIGAACVFACAAFGAIAPSQAQDRGFRKDDLQQQQPPRDNGGERNAQRQDVPRFEPRDTRLEDSRRAQPERAAEPQRHNGRLTPDEKRDLRRQINEAGVDLYPNTPRR